MKRLFGLLIISFICLDGARAQHITDESKVQWKGFEKTIFKFDGIPAFYVSPKKALPGNPWIWQAHFPDWHTQVDSILLERGFHVAYVNTNDLFGHPKAMMIWDRFYDYLTKEKAFSTRPALEGVSRGGLYVYGWAKRNPSKLSCLYCEGPVCDFKSWPGGKGIGKGSKKDWEKLKSLFGLTEEQAMEYKDQPKEDLEGLASFRIPILHVIGLTDSVVPNEENTFVLVNRYIRLGGTATVVPMPREMPGNSGHHYYIENPEALADFVFTYAAHPKPTLPSEDFIYPYGNLDHVLHRIQSGQDITVAFLGGSITYMNGWRQKVCTYLSELFPNSKFNFINAGVSSLGSVPHAFRMEKELLYKGRIDLLFVESAVNDYANHTPEIQQRRALEGIIRKAYQSNPMMDVVMMAFADEFKLADYQSGKIPTAVQSHDEVAKYYKVPFINLAEEVNKRIDNKEFTWEYDFKSLHPAPFGQEIYFNTIKTFLRKSFIKDKINAPSAIVLSTPMDKLNYANGDFLPLEDAIKKKGFTVDASWHPRDSVATREGFVDVPVLVGDKPGDYFQVPFQGTAVGIAVICGPDAGAIKYSIDGKNEKRVDLFFQPHSAYLYFPQYLMLGDDLKKGRHLLKVKIDQEHNEKSKGNTVRIVHFFHNG